MNLCTPKNILLQFVLGSVIFGIDLLDEVRMSLCCETHFAPDLVTLTFDVVALEVAVAMIKPCTKCKLSMPVGCGIHSKRRGVGSSLTLVRQIYDTEKN